MAIRQAPSNWNAQQPRRSVPTPTAQMATPAPAYGTAARKPWSQATQPPAQAGNNQQNWQNRLASMNPPQQAQPMPMPPQQGQTAPNSIADLIRGQAPPPPPPPMQPQNPGYTDMRYRGGIQDMQARWDGMPANERAMYEQGGTVRPQQGGTQDMLARMRDMYGGMNNRGRPVASQTNLLGNQQNTWQQRMSGGMRGDPSPMNQARPMDMRRGGYTGAPRQAQISPQGVNPGQSARGLMAGGY